MSFVKRGFLNVNSILHESRRFRGKINIKRPQVPHFTRKVTLDICKPQYPNKLKIWEICRLNEKDRRIVEIHNPLEDILAKECLNWFKHSRMIAFVHLNPIKLDRKFSTVQELAFENMNVRQYGKKIVKQALVGTHYEACTKMFVSHNDIIFSEEIKPKKLLDILKKIPQMVLMAVIVEGKLLSKNEFVEYANLPPLDVLRSQLCNVMQSAGSSVVSQLNMHQSTLVSHLDNYVKIQQENDKTISEKMENSSVE